MLTGLVAQTLYHYQVSSTDDSGNTGPSADLTFTTAPPDTTAPVLSNISTSAGAMMVTWTTDEPATSRVDYGLDTGYGSVVEDLTLTLNHSVELTGLVPGTLYHYQVSSTDGSSNAAASADLTFTTTERVTAGLQVLYAFYEGGGSTVQDVSGVGNPLDLTLSDLGAVTWLPNGGLSVDASTVITSSGPAIKVITALQASQALTLEVWIKPANVTQDGPARILTLSQDGNSNGGNFILGQGSGSDPTVFTARLRTTR